MKASAVRAFLLFLCVASIGLPAPAQEKSDDDTGSSYDYEPPALPEMTREERTAAVRELKRVERRSKKFGIFLNRGKMEKIKGDRIRKVLREFDRFVGILEELPEGFVKACKIGSVWFSDEIVDISGSHAAGTASGEGINLSMGFGRGTVYHEMFHKFECCITDSQRREWNELNPDEFIYEGSHWDSFAGNDKYSKKAAARHLKRIKAGKEKTASEKLEESRSKKDNKRIAANKTNETVQAAFTGGYAQTTPLEDRACTFAAMMAEGPRFFLRTQRSEHMRNKMEFLLKLTGTKKYLGADFWEERSDVSSGGGVYAVSGSSAEIPLAASDMPSADPGAMGYDAKTLAALAGVIGRRGIGTGAMVVAVNGKVIFEYGDTARPMPVSSCWASLLSMLYGRFVKMNRIDLDETLESVGITEVGGLERREREAKVRDLLSSRSCCFIRASNDPPGRKLPDRTSRLPGNMFFYSNWDINVAASVFEKKTGSDFVAAFDEMVAKPLRLQDWRQSLQRREGDSLVSEHLAWQMNLSARDMAKIGQMMLNRGRWKGLQLVPAPWVEKSTGIVSKFPNGGGFGYLWWVENEAQDAEAYRGAYSARGLEGQRLTVLPQLGMVVAHLPKGNGQKVKGADYRKILKAIFMSRKPPAP